MINLKLEEAEGHEQLITTLAKGEIKILTGEPVSTNYKCIRRAKS